MSTRFLVFALFLAWAIAAVHQAHSLETDKTEEKTDNEDAVDTSQASTSAELEESKESERRSPYFRGRPRHGRGRTGFGGPRGGFHGHRGGRGSRGSWPPRGGRPPRRGYGRSHHDRFSGGRGDSGSFGGGPPSRDDRYGRGGRGDFGDGQSDGGRGGGRSSWSDGGGRGGGPDYGGGDQYSSYGSAASCADLAKNGRPMKSGVYSISPGGRSLRVYCYFETVGTCGEGPWTPVMNVNGLRPTFRYSSNYWTSVDSTLNVRAGTVRFGTDEMKLPTYGSAPFTSICLIFNTGGIKKYVLVTVNGRQPSLGRIIARGRFIHPHLPITRKVWEWAIPGADLQPHCHREGFNVVAGMRNHAQARIGVMSNNEKNCYSCDSYIGVGTQGSGCGCPQQTCGVYSAGNINFCSRSRNPAFVHMLIR